MKNIYVPALFLALCTAATAAFAEDPAPDAGAATDAPASTPTAARVVVTKASAPPTTAQPSSLTALPEDLYISYGEAKVIPLRNIDRVALGNGKVISTTVLEKQLVVIGEAPGGETNMLVWFKNGTMRKFFVHVTYGSMEGIEQQVRMIVEGMPGIKVQRMGSQQILVSGSTSKINLDRISPILKDNFKPVVVNIVREEDVTMKKMIYLKISLVEFKRSALQNIGVDWATSISGPTIGFAWDVLSSSKFIARQPDAILGNSLPLNGYTIPGATPGTQPTLLGSLPARVSPPKAYLGVATGITSTINLAVQNGDAYVLATPELSTRSGGTADFLAGGQVPIVTPASGLSPATVQFKDYGIKISIQPNADDDNNIMATIKSEVSSLDYTTAVAGNPGLLTRTSNSEINVKDGQTLVMSGLVNRDMVNQIDKFPFLGDLPIIGALFKSKNFTSNRTDLVIFVTPQIVDPSSTVTQERVQKARDIEEKFDDFVQKKETVN